VSLAMFPFIWGQGGTPSVGVVGVSAAEDLLTTSLSVAVPRGARSGDTLVAVSQGSELVGVVPPVGWTVGAGPTNGAAIASIVYDGVTPSFLFTTLSAVAQVVVIVAVRGFTLGVVGTFSVDAVSPTPPSIVVPVAASLNLAVVASDAGQSYSMPSGWSAKAFRNARRTITVFQNDGRVPAGSLAGVQITRTAGAANGRAAQIALTAL
jgi:hypothetical protein